MREQLAITRIYVRRYRDNGQTVAYVDWSDGSRTEAGIMHPCHHAHHSGWARSPKSPSFGGYMHAVFARARREGLKLQRETW
jgi:hypothetical protein